MSTLAAFLAQHLAAGAILVRVEQAEGSTPREAGAAMAVSAAGIAGTIGGGQLEFHCLDIARTMLETAECERLLDLPLGPQMGQCCGGRVLVSLRRAGPADLAIVQTREAAEASVRQRVLIFGAGHTGRALAQAVTPLPFAVSLIDDRDGVLDGLPRGVTAIRSDDPAEQIAAAPAGSAYVVLTHSHALDYRLVEAALARGDGSYVGMIGSATKRARFESHFLRSGGTRAALARLICPIGGADVDDKRPAVIAALTAAELARTLLGRRVTHAGSISVTRVPHSRG